MGTFGTGPFDNDRALELIEDLASRPVAERGAALGELLGFVLGNPQLLGHKFFPHEVVAASALVAAGLPEGADVRAGLALVAPGTALPADTAELAPAALAALASYAGSWNAGWATAAEARAARRTVDRLAEILRTS
jgi:hypothetical protein